MRLNAIQKTTKQNFCHCVSENSFARKKLNTLYGLNLRFILRHIYLSVDRKKNKSFSWKLLWQFYRKHSSGWNSARDHKTRTLRCRKWSHLGESISSDFTSDVHNTLAANLSIKKNGTYPSSRNRGLLGQESISCNNLHYWNSLSIIRQNDNKSERKCNFCLHSTFRCS